MELVEKCFDVIPDKLPSKDYHAILNAANHDIERIKKAVEVLKQQKNVESVTAFLIAAIKNDYESGKVQHFQKKVPLNTCLGFPQRSYDYDELEKYLLNDNISHYDCNTEDIEKLLQDARDSSL